MTASVLEKREAWPAAVVDALRTVYDPEIPTNIFDLGLIYDVATPAPGEVAIRMTLTAPACPVAGTLPGVIQQTVEAVEGVDHCAVELVWDPPWNREMMSEEAQLALGML